MRFQRLLGFDLFKSEIIEFITMDFIISLVIMLTNIIKI